MAFLDKIANETKEVVQVLTGISFTKPFTSTPNMQGVQQVVGFSENTFGYVDSKYRVVISNKDWVVNAWLQEETQINVDSTWGDLINIPAFAKGLTQAMEDTINMGVKAAFGVTPKNMAMTRRKWTGSSPLKFNLKLRFRAYNDAQIEVLKACQALQEMALPEEIPLSSVPWANKLFPDFQGSMLPGFLIPPGPNEQYMGIASNYLGDTRFGRAGDVISLSLFGGLFKLGMVIIKAVNVSYDPKMTDKGPVAATADVIIESYEILSKQKLRKAYGNQGNSKTGVTL